MDCITSSSMSAHVRQRRGDRVPCVNLSSGSWYAQVMVQYCSATAWKSMRFVLCVVQVLNSFEQLCRVFPASFPIASSLWAMRISHHFHHGFVVSHDDEINCGIDCTALSTRLPPLKACSRLSSTRTLKRSTMLPGWKRSGLLPPRPVGSARRL